jgi:ElaB/YqjD/DUF883 family membrane-anchored ribosome-binding protein
MPTESNITPGNVGTNSVSGAAMRAHHLVDDVAEKATPAVKSATAAAHQTIDKVATAGASAADWVASSSKKVKDNGTAMADAASGQIRARPLATVAGALVLGYLIGRILR